MYTCTKGHTITHTHTHLGTNIAITIRVTSTWVTVLLVILQMALCGQICRMVHWSRASFRWSGWSIVWQNSPCWSISWWWLNRWHKFNPLLRSNTASFALFGPPLVKLFYKGLQCCREKCIILYLYSVAHFLEVTYISYRMSYLVPHPWGYKPWVILIAHHN